MRSLIFFCSKWRVYLSEIPPIILLIIAIRFNEKMDTALKLYPLIILMSATIIFIAVYFTRLLIISKDEIRNMGVFTAREKALITKEKTLVITLLKKRRIRVDLVELSDLSVYTWLKSEPMREIRLFSEKANGSINSVRRIFKHFEIDSKEIADALTKDNFCYENENVKVTSGFNTDKEREFRIFFKETLF